MYIKFIAIILKQNTLYYCTDFKRYEIFILRKEYFMTTISSLGGDKPFSTISGSCYVGMTESDATSRREKREFRKTDTNHDGKLTGSEIVARRRDETRSNTIEAEGYVIGGSILVIGGTIISATGIGAPLGAGIISAGMFVDGAAAGRAIANDRENRLTNEYEEQHRFDENY